MRNFLRGALALSLLLSYASAAAPSHAQTTRPAQAPQSPRGITAEDYYAFEFVGDPRLSPDGRWVAYVVTTVDQRQNRRLSQIWLAAADGSRPPRQFTTSPQSSNSPRWSPDGRTLAFISTRPDGGTQAGASSSSTTATPSTSTSATSSPASNPEPQTTGTPTPASTPGQTGTATTPGVSSALQTAAAAGDADAALAGLAALARRRRGAPRDESSERRRQLRVVARRHALRPHEPQRAERYAKPPERRAPLQAHHRTSSTTRGWFDDKRATSGSSTSRSGAATQMTSGDDWNDTDPRGRPTATQHRLRLGPHGQGVRREPQHGRLGVSTRTAARSPRSPITTSERQLAALVARRKDDRLRQLGAGNRDHPKI